MEYRYLGNSGLRVSVLSFGSWVTFGSQIEIETAKECMVYAYEHGINFFDTAEVYAQGKAEEVMGQVLEEQAWPRDSYVLSTKIFWGGSGVNQQGLSRKHIIEGTKASLKRLKVDYVDLIYAHRPDPTTPIEETVRAFDWVINQGWAFYWGTSEWDARQLAEAYAIADRLGLHKPLMEQPQYNMLHRERFEVEYLPLYKERGLGTTIWSPLASGLLTGKYTDGIPEDSRFGKADALGIRPYLSWLRRLEEDRDALVKVLRALADVAKELECTPAQLAIAWCIKNPHVSSVILGASRVSQVEENLKALEVVAKLTKEKLNDIEDILGNKPTPPPILKR